MLTLPYGSSRVKVQFVAKIDTKLIRLSVAKNVLKLADLTAKAIKFHSSMFDM
jgi:hypothetical protein